MNNIYTLPILSLILSITTIIIFFIYVFQLKKKIKKRATQNTGQVHLSFQRERIENEIYDATSKLVSDSLRFSDTNHLLIKTSSNDITISPGTTDYSFFSDLGINLSEINVEDKLITCLMPFHKNFDKLYANIKNTCAMQHYHCIRSDEKFITGNILKYTVELILKSQVLIAVLDGRNPNVFYEIGIAHSIGKNVILLSDYSRMGDIPFDLQSNRLIFYKSPQDLQDKLSKSLKSIHHDT